MLSDKDPLGSGYDLHDEHSVAHFALGSTIKVAATQTSMLYAMLSADLEMIVAARVGCCLDASDLPTKLSRDPQFWKAVLAERFLFWEDLPEAFKLVFPLRNAVSQNCIV